MNSITADMAEQAFSALRRWFRDHNQTWLDEVAIAWLDIAAKPIYCRCGHLGTIDGIRRAINAATNPDNLTGMAIKTGNNRLLGYIGISSHRSEAENLLMLGLASELTLDPGLMTDATSHLIVEKYFTQVKITPPTALYAHKPLPSFSSQTGLQSLMTEADNQGLLPGGQYGVPPLDTAPLAKPAPGVNLITEVPGFGGGLNS